MWSLHTVIVNCYRHLEFDRFGCSGLRYFQFRRFCLGQYQHPFPTFYELYAWIISSLLSNFASLLQIAPLFTAIHWQTAPVRFKTSVIIEATAVHAVFRQLQAPGKFHLLLATLTPPALEAFWWALERLFPAPPTLVGLHHVLPPHLTVCACLARVVAPRGWLCGQGAHHSRRLISPTLRRSFSN